MGDELELETSTPRARRRARLGLIAAGIVAVAALLGGSLISDDGQDVAASEDTGSQVDQDDEGVEVLGSTTTPDGSSSTTESSVADEPFDGEGPVLGEDPQTIENPSPESTTTTTICLNSFDDGCGPFHWNRPVGVNQPMIATIELLTEHPVAGQIVEFRLRASDPDATPFHASAWLDFPSAGESRLEPGNCWGTGRYEGFGPWAPPSPRGGSIETVGTILPHEPGVYRVFGCFNSESWPRVDDGPGSDVVKHSCPGDGARWAFEGWVCADPYGDFASPYIDVTVYAE